MIRWRAHGAADGFNLIFPGWPGSLERSTVEVVPARRERGYFADPSEESIKPLREPFGRAWTSGQYDPFLVLGVWAKAR